MEKIVYIQDHLSFELDNSNLTATIVKSSKASGNILIPRSVIYQSQDYVITKIGEKAFYNNKNLKSINFTQDSELRSIGKKAFTNSSIETLYIPSKFELFEEDWCYDAYGLNNIYISAENKNFKYLDESNKIIVGKSNPNDDNYETIIYIDQIAKEIKIPSTIKRIDSCQISSFLKTIKFEGKSSLESIQKNAFSVVLKENMIPNNFTVPPSVKYMGCIGSLPVKRFHQLISPENPNFKYINDDSIILSKSNPNKDEFDVIISARQDIKKAIIPSNIKYIYPYAFYKCEELKTVEFQSNSNLISIEKFAFFGSGIKEIKIPSSCQKIKNQAFFDCRNLLKFELPPDSQIKTIPKMMFNRSKTSFFIPKSVEKIKPRWGLFSNYSNLVISPDNHNFSFLNDEHNIIVGKSDSKSEIFDVIISASIDIEKVYIPSEITRIESYAFFQCKKISTIEFDKDIQLKSIGSNAFGSTSIQEINIPSSVVDISNNCFVFSMNLITVNIPEDSQLKIIGNKAFTLTKCKKIFIPANVIEFHLDIDEIELSSENPNFKYLDEEKKIVVGKSNSESDFDSIVYASKDVQKALIPSNIKYINNFSFYGCTELDEVNFEENSQLIYIGFNAFANSSLTEITIPSHVKEINDFCFEYCPNLLKLEFEPNSEIQSFSDYFIHGSGIESISIPSSIKKLNSNWLSSATYLNNIYLSPENENIKYSDDSYKMILSKSNENSNVFDVISFVNRDCTELTIPSTIKTIACYSFSNTQVQNVFIPKNVTQILIEAFNDCDALSIEFEEDSNLELLEYLSLGFKYINTFKLPRKIKYLDLSAFVDSPDWKFAEVLSDEIYVYCNPSSFRFAMSFPNAHKIKFDVNLSFESIVFTLPNIEFINLNE